MLPILTPPLISGFQPNPFSPLQHPSTPLMAEVENSLMLPLSVQSR